MSDSETPPWERRLSPAARIAQERVTFRNAVMDSDLSIWARMLALAYESYAGRGLGRVWASDDNLARRSGIASKTTRRKYRRVLIERGVLTPVTGADARRGRVAEYRLDYRPLLDGVHGHAHGVHSHAPTGSRDDPVQGHGMTPSRGHRVTPNRDWNKNVEQRDPSVADAARGAGRTTPTDLNAAIQSAPLAACWEAFEG